MKDEPTGLDLWKHPEFIAGHAAGAAAFNAGPSVPAPQNPYADPAQRALWDRGFDWGQDDAINSYEARDYKLGVAAVRMLCEDAAPPHEHIEIAPEVMANMDPKASPETRDALVAMARLATKCTAADLIADHFDYRVLRDEPWLPGDVMIHDGAISVVLRKLTPTSKA